MDRTPLGAFAKRHRLAFALGGIVLAAAVILPACLSSPTFPSAIPTSMVLYVTSAPTTGNVVAGATRQYRMEIRDQDDLVISGMTVATWSIVGAPGIASVVLTGSSLTDNSRGLATCLTAGTVTVRATRQSLSADATLQCIAPTDMPTTMAIVVTSSPPTGAVIEGATRQYGIEVRNSFGTLLTFLTSATWSIVGPSGTATITPTAGLATCIRAGSIGIHAVGPIGPAGTNLTADVTLQCIEPPGNPATMLLLTPWTLTPAVGGTATATASFRDAGGLPTTNGCPISFTIEPTAPSIATVSGSGLTATVTGVGAGRRGLRATCTPGGALTALARVEVTAAPLNIARIAMETSYSYFPASASASSLQYFATAHTASGSMVAGAGIVYTIVGGTAATIASNGNVTVAASPGAMGPPFRGGAVVTATAGGHSEVAFLTYGDAGTIHGVIASTLGNYVGSSTVTATNTATSEVTSAGGIMNDGHFYLVGLLSGTYTVVVGDGASTQSQSFTNVVVTAGQSTLVNVVPFALRAGN